MNILVLSSGSDQAFLENGYQYPKNLIEISGKPLIQHVLESFGDVIGRADRLLLSLKKEESERYHTSTVVKLLVPNCQVYETSRETMGATCTALLSVEAIDNDAPLVIINGDIVLEEPVQNAVDYFRQKDADGGAITFESVHPRWSYVKCDDRGYVIEATEKRPISKIATAGVYYYKKGSDFVGAAKNSIRKDARIDGKFYICPVFNEMILNQKKVVVFPVESGRYHSLATPAGVENYEKYLKEKLR